jgi:MOSC domain-containing protein YiiM
MTNAHVIRALWVRPAAGAALEPRAELVLETGRGIVGDHTFGRLRHVTIVFEADWRAAETQLGRSVDPVARRANVLVSGGGGARFVGGRIRLGDAVVEIKGVTRPCPVMERGAVGLEAALRPDGRGGIWGRVVAGATIRLGDPWSLHAAAAEPR